MQTLLCAAMYLARVPVVRVFTDAPAVIDLARTTMPVCGGAGGGANASVVGHCWAGRVLGKLLIQGIRGVRVSAERVLQW